jgi:hypothetical protein
MAQATNVERLQAAAVIDGSKLNDAQKAAINGLSSEETDSLILIASKVKSSLKDTKDQSMLFPF